MIPSVLSGQVRRGVEDFLLTTFPVTTPFFARSLPDLLETNGSVFKGPYLSLKLPFLSGRSKTRFFPEILSESFRPHLHQEKAFERLGAGPSLSTLLATGTGSGKTECFLYPILDYCRRNVGRKGVKAVVIYPMNALATDQARRFARAIAASPELSGKVTAGLYIGGEGREKHVAMGPDDVITDHAALRRSPPDILLTNYKMLDYLLVRPDDAALWGENGPETLKLLVVDELHTFDGAQGADLACLIRRLKARLKTPEGHLCCVGTSATLGEGPGGLNAESLRDYAQQLFGEPFPGDAIVGEFLESPEEFLSGHLVTRFAVPGPERKTELDPLGYGSREEYLRAQGRLWLDEEVDPADPASLVALAASLKRHAFFRNLLVILGGRAKELHAVADELARQVPGFAHPDGTYLDRLIGSFLALISEARKELPKESDGKESSAPPLVQVRLQLWLRELSRLVAIVEKRGDGGSPHIAFADDLSGDEAKRALPLVHCRECGMTGWGGVYKAGDQKVAAELRSFYESFFHFSPNVVFVFPDDGAAAEEQGQFQWWLCTGCLRLVQGTEAAECPGCAAGADAAISVRVPECRRKDRDGRTHGTHDCPFCNGHNSLTIMGSRAASLTSVALSQLFASRFNDDKKLLAFSDSVQDASHRAGFFGARTYTFNFRTAVQKVVAAQAGPVPFSEMATRFLTHWRQELPDDGRFVATFLAPDMSWLRDYEELRETGRIPVGSNLVDLVERRVAWEIWSEYTFDSRIGRTLEKSGNSGLEVRRDLLDEAVAALLLRLTEEIGGLRELDAPTLYRFLLGFIVALKDKGGVAHPDLSLYVESGGNSYLLNKQAHLPKFGRTSRAPAFLSTQTFERFNTIVRTNPNTPTWFEDWMLRSLGFVDRGISGYLREVWTIVVDELEKAGVLVSWTGPKQARIWGLPAELFLVTGEVVQFRCGRCSTNVSVAAAEEELWAGAPCQRYRCGGLLTRESDREGARDDYYRRLYATGDVSRLFAEEHTGLLPRDERERIEEEFIDGTGPGDPNLLSCTPTLEMGIDIGDLSSLALCSIPPKPSNYLQRIGRAGRHDGNAFILAVANGRPHDLFFFFEPEEMIQGLVEPPGCFLNASAVLERQFTGFVFDRWVEKGLPSEAIPRKLQAVLDSVEKGAAAPDAFPNNILKFFDLNRTPLEDGFFGMFGDEISGHSRERLRHFIRGEVPGVVGMKVRLVTELQEVVAERKSLRNAIRRLTDRVDKVEAEPAGGEDQKRELDDLKQEKSALNRVVKEINDKHTLNFLTDAGLLPNYAFPEAGVTLKSVIYRKNEKAGADRKYETRSYEYERPAAAAILELAPTNAFYAQGRKLVVDQVNIDLSKPEAWRFCADCSYMQMEGEGELAQVCPRCGHALWSDAGQRHPMLRMKQVLSTQDDRDSRSHDENDGREPEFFQRNMFVIPDNAELEAAYALDVDDVPFGFEFFLKLTLREANLGKKETGQPNLTIGGEQYEDTGFVVCKACGKVKGIRKGRRNGLLVPMDHALHCRFRAAPGGTAPPDEKAAFSAYFLYRQFDSEGIRILLPVAKFDVEQKVESFVAALDLGLKKRFRGDPGHLLTTVYSDPVKGSGVRRRFLVLYDGVPGGTGYLKELMRDENGLLDVLQMAMDVLERCTCQHDPTKDGCYRCLLAYRGRHDKLKTSRRAAMEILGSILRHRQTIRKIETLGAIPLGSLLESELEALFLEALRRKSVGGKPVQLVPHVVNGKAGWFLKTAVRNWLIEPQAELGPDQGVEIFSRADFVLHPEGAGKALPIAVFTDGYEYHADPDGPHQRLGIDTAQRLALVRSGRYRVFSLNWEDVQQGLETNAAAVFEPLGGGKQTMFRQVAERLDPDGAADWIALRSASSFSLLTAFLEKAETRDWSLFAASWLLPFLEQGRSVATASVRAVRDALLAPEGANGASSLMGGAATDWQTGRIGELLLESFPVTRGLAFAETAKLGAPEVAAALAVSLRLDEDAGKKDPKGWKAAWRRFLWAMNVVQFIPRCEFVTSRGLQESTYKSLLDDLFSPPEPVQAQTTGPIAAMLHHADASVRDLISQVAAGGHPLPEVGYELADEAGEIVATAELAWEAARVAVLTARDEEFRAAFEARGWAVLSATEGTDANFASYARVEAALTGIGKSGSEPEQ